MPIEDLSVNTGLSGVTSERFVGMELLELRLGHKYTPRATLIRLTAMNAFNIRELDDKSLRDGLNLGNHKEPIQLSSGVWSGVPSITGRVAIFPDINTVIMNSELHEEAGLPIQVLAASLFYIHRINPSIAAYRARHQLGLETKADGEIDYQTQQSSLAGTLDYMTTEILGFTFGKTLPEIRQLHQDVMEQAEQDLIGMGLSRGMDFTEARNHARTDGFTRGHKYALDVNKSLRTKGLTLTQALNLSILNPPIQPADLLRGVAHAGDLFNSFAGKR